MITNLIDLVLKRNKNLKLRSRIIIGLVIIIGILSVVSNSLAGELIKNVTRDFDYGIYDSRMDGIRTNMGCATIVGKAESNGLACMQNLYNKCNNLKIYSFVSNCLIFVVILLLVFNYKDSEGKYKVGFICLIISLVLKIINTYYTIIMKNKSIKDSNCGLKNIEKTKMKYGASFYLNMVELLLMCMTGGLMVQKYKKILF